MISVELEISLVCGMSSDLRECAMVCGMCSALHGCAMVCGMCSALRECAMVCGMSSALRVRPELHAVKSRQHHPCGVGVSPTAQPYGRPHDPMVHAMTLLWPYYGPTMARLRPYSQLCSALQSALQPALYTCV